MRRGILSSLCVAAAICAAAGLVAVERGGAPAVVRSPNSPMAARVALRPAPVPSPTPPSFDVVKVAPDGSAVLAGRAEPGDRVTVFDGNKPLGAVTADRRGEWVLAPTAPLPPGDRELRLEAAGRHGAMLRSRQSVALAIAPAAGKGETALAVALPRRGPVTVLQRPDGAAAGGLSIDAVEYGGAGGIALSGHAAPGSSLELYLGGRPLAAATADAAGRWSTTAPAGGAGRLRLDEIGPGGRVVRRIAVPLLRPVAARLSPGQAYIVRPGNNLWQIARRSYGSGLRYAIIYSANIAKIRDPDLIYPGQVFLLPKS